MQNLATVAVQVGVLFALMAVGAVCRRVRLVDESSVKGIVNVLLLVVTPSLIIDSFQRPFDSSMMRGFFWAFAIASFAHFAIILFARLFSRGDDRSRPVLRLAMVFSNAGFMGIPLEQAILGAEGVFYGIVYVVVFNFFMWSWGLYEMRGKVPLSNSNSKLQLFHWETVRRRPWPRLPHAQLPRWPCEVADCRSYGVS